MGFFDYIFGRENNKISHELPSVVSLVNYEEPINDMAAAIRSGRIESRISIDALNKGDMKLTTGIKVDGSHEGGIHIEEKKGILYVTPTGKIVGNISAQQIYIQGKFDGVAKAYLVMIEKSANISGTIIANRVECRNVNRVTINAEIISHEYVPNIVEDLTLESGVVAKK